MLLEAAIVRWMIFNGSMSEPRWRGNPSMSINAK